MIKFWDLSRAHHRSPRPLVGRRKRRSRLSFPSPRRRVANLQVLLVGRRGDFRTAAVDGILSEANARRAVRPDGGGRRTHLSGYFQGTSTARPARPGLCAAARTKNASARSDSDPLPTGEEYRGRERLKRHQGVAGGQVRGGGAFQSAAVVRCPTEVIERSQAPKKIGVGRSREPLPRRPLLSLALAVWWARGGLRRSARSTHAARARPPNLPIPQRIAAHCSLHLRTKASRASCFFSSPPPRIIHPPQNTCPVKPCSEEPNGLVYAADDSSSCLSRRALREVCRFLARRHW